MSKRVSLLFKSVLMILKNATIVIPLFEGLIETIYSLHHQQEEPKEIKDEKIADSKDVEATEV